MPPFIKIKPNSGWASAVGDSLRERFDHFVGQLGIEIRHRVARRTPVLTGRARGNWNLAFNNPDWNFDWQYFDPTGELGDNDARSKAENAKAGDTIYVSNGLPYINRLNHGWSKKAPPGFIELTASEVPFIAQQVANGEGDRLHGRANIFGGEDGP